jgi:hypothetical protein
MIIVLCLTGILKVLIIKHLGFNSYIFLPVRYHQPSCQTTNQIITLLDLDELQQVEFTLLKRSTYLLVYIIY